MLLIISLKIILSHSHYENINKLYKILTSSFYQIFFNIIMLFCFLPLYLAYDPVVPAQNFKSNQNRYCIGYENIDTKGYYLTTTKLECGKVFIGDGPINDVVLPGIVAYDRAQKNGAYIGQINAITVSSFSGPGSGVWGYDYAKADGLRSAKIYDKKNVKLPSRTIVLPKEVPVYEIYPLLDATQELFGTVDNRKEKFPPMPGCHVASAAKSANSLLDENNMPRPGYVWSYIALCIAEDRTNDSSLFVEDCGFYAMSTQNDEWMDAKMRKKRDDVVASCLACGVNQHVTYKEIFTGYKYLYCKAGEYGTAIAYAPYVLLASDAYPPATPTETPAERLVKMSLDEWKAAVFGPGTRKK